MILFRLLEKITDDNYNEKYNEIFLYAYLTFKTK